MIIAPNATDVSVYWKLVDPAAGTPETGLVIANLDATYIRDRAAAVKNDLSTPGGFVVTSVHTDNAAIEVDGTNAPGVYRVDFPDAAFAAGVARVQLVINGAAIDPAVIEVELVPWVTLITGAGVLVGATQGDVTWGAQVITTAGGDALTIAATGANGDAVSLAGNGTGAGMKVTAGATGYGVQISAGGSNGVQIDGGGGGNSGIDINGPGSGITANGGTDYGAYFLGGNYGLYAYGGDTGLFTYGATDYGQFNSGRMSGTYNYGDDGAGSGVGQTNYGAQTGEQNIGIADYGEYNTGGTTGSYNNGTAEYGIQAIGGTADTDPDWATAAAILAQAQAALVSYGLDHVRQVAGGASKPTDGSDMDLIMNKDAAQTFDASTDSLEAISDKLTSAQITVTSPVAGSHLTVVRGDTLSASVSGLGSVAARTKLWFTVKARKADTDLQAVIQVLESKPGVATDGLQRLNGAAGTAAQGSLTVTDEAAGNVTIALAAAATALLREQSCYYDIQMLTATGVTTMATGQLDVNLDVTAATS